MEKIKTRGQVDPSRTWDLSLMYKSEEEWEKDFARLEKLLAKFTAFKGKLGKSPENLLGAYQASDEFSMVVEKLYVYAHLKSDEDTANSANKSRLDRIAEKYTELSARCAWFSPELLALPEKTFEAYRKSPVLAFYRRSLDNEARYRPHTLSAPEERLLSLSSNVLGSASDIFSAFNDADLEFPSIREEDGKKIQVTHGNYILLMRSNSRTVRKNAFRAVHGTFAKFRNTLASSLYANTKKNIFYARTRSFPTALEASLFSDNVPRGVYDGLIDAVHENLPSMYRYMELRAGHLGLKHLDMCDVYNSLIPECELKITWEEAVQHVKKALKVLGPEYGKVADMAFRERWMDVEETKGKRSGAYSSGCYCSRPYMLLNHKDDLNGVSTLAHELGHSVHSYFSNTNQKYHYADYRIFVAEVASTTNELLLHEYMMKQAKSAKVRAYLLNQLIDEIRATLFRQTMFAEFERSIYEKAEKGIPLTADLLDDIYYKLNTLYFGPVMKADKLISAEWSRIPHFYTSFYVYKYATGISAAIALSRHILEGTREPYLGFLKAGGSKDVLDIMKDAGVDFSTGKPVREALRYFDTLVTDFAEALEKLPSRGR